MKTKNYLFLLIVLLFTSSHVFAQLTILSGPKQASYYQFVDDIVKVSNGEVVNQASSGAAYNYSQLVDPKSPIKIAMMQSDYLYYAQMMDNRNNKFLHIGAWSRITPDIAPNKDLPKKPIDEKI